MMENVERKKFIKAYVTDNLHEYVSTMSQEMGMSNSAFCVMCINQYKQSMEALNTMAKMEQMVTELKALQLANKK